jgi:hypothetical protein
MSEQAKKKREYMKELYETKSSKKECLKEFNKKYPCHRSTAYDYYLIAYRGYASKRVTEKGLRKYRESFIQGKCYFCNERKEESHHLDYLNNITINLCRSCHKKVHIIFKQYHELIASKDKILINIKKSLGIS